MSHSAFHPRSLWQFLQGFRRQGNQAKASVEKPAELWANGGQGDWDHILNLQNKSWRGQSPTIKGSFSQGTEIKSWTGKPLQEDRN